MPIALRPKALHRFLMPKTLYGGRGLKLQRTYTIIPKMVFSSISNIAFKRSGQETRITLMSVINDLMIFVEQKQVRQRQEMQIAILVIQLLFQAWMIILLPRAISVTLAKPDFRI